MLKFSRQILKQRSSVNSIERSYISSTRRFLTSRPIITYKHRTTTYVNSKSFIPFGQYDTVRYFASKPDDYPPHILLGMPALSPTMEQGNLREWLKKPGDEVVVGDALADIETDKATMKWDSMDDGYFVKAFVENETDGIEVGKVIALLAEDPSDVDKFNDFVPPDSLEEEGSSSTGADTKNEEKEQKKEENKEKKQESSSKTESKSQESNKEEKSTKKRSSGDRLVVSPVARAVASELGIDLNNVTGSGPNGRIVLADVQKLKGTTKESSSSKQSSTPAQSSGEYEEISNSNIRKVIASRLTESKQKIPHYYLTVDFCVDKLQEIRSDLNARANGKYKLSINDFVIKASAMTMRKVPGVNSSWSEKAIKRYNDVNINVAVNSDLGLFTPLVPKTDNKGLIDIANSVRSLADKAKDGKLSTEELQIGTFTISNLGMFGIKQFAAVINPPQACILAVGGIETRVVPDGESFKTSNFMTCTLSCDHRVVDGALGAQWLKEFKSKMEDPITLLL